MSSLQLLGYQTLSLTILTTTTIMTSYNHIVVIPIGKTSHLRQHLHLTFNLLILHPTLIVTVLMATSTQIKWDKEIKHGSAETMVKVQDRWRVVVVDDQTDEPPNVGLVPVMHTCKVMVDRCEKPLERVLAGNGVLQGDKWHTKPCMIMPDVSVG